jgi:hypothetical protein
MEVETVQELTHRFRYFRPDGLQLCLVGFNNFFPSRVRCVHCVVADVL